MSAIMSNDGRLDRAIEKLKKRGHRIGLGGLGPGMMSPEGIQIVVDDVLRTTSEIYEMAGESQDA
jgi:uncharacterized UPF0146 family protein